mgnify:FL=1
MKKRGFTLIELLAVIVVLAIIALIATPIVMNTIKNAKKGAAERSADSYLKQLELTIAETRLENKPVSDGTYSINAEGNLEGNGLITPLVVEMNGNKPTGGTVVITNGEVSPSETNMIIGEYNLRYNETSKSYTAEVAVKLCKKASSVNLSDLKLGDEFTCDLGDEESTKNLVFYVLEKNGSQVSLIMNKVFTTPAGDKVPYSMKANVFKLFKYTKLDESQITLPSGEQIAAASNNTTWTPSGSNTALVTNQMPDWLKTNLDVTGTFCYWTSTAYDSSKQWGAGLKGLYAETATSATCGFRPVITVSTSDLG